MKSLGINNTIITARGVDYGCFICGVSKSEAVNLLENLVLNNKRSK